MTISRPAPVSGVQGCHVLVWTADVDGNADGEFRPSLTSKLLRVLMVPGVDAEAPRDGHNVALFDPAASMFSAVEAMVSTAI